VGRVESTINGYDPIDRNPQPNRVTIIETASVFVVLIVRFLQGYWPLGYLGFLKKHGAHFDEKYLWD